MKKIEIICAIIIVCGILTIGYLNAHPKETIIIEQTPNCEVKPVETIVPTGCFVINNTGERDVCLRNEPYEKWDCTKFTDYLFVITCYQTLAEYYKDAQYCIKLKTDYDRDTCYMKVANAANNPVLCMNILFPDIRYACYRKINLKGISPDVCNSGWTLEERHECRELITEANK